MFGGCGVHRFRAHPVHRLTHDACYGRQEIFRIKDKTMNVRKYVTAAMTGLFVSHGIAQASDCKWQATIAPPPQLSDFLTLTVKGVCQEPTPGYMLTLNRVNLTQTDASTLTLVLDVVAPTGIEPQIATPTPVEYRQAVVRPMAAPSKVIVWETAATIDVGRGN
jgi:hypothetical protein